MTGRPATRRGRCELCGAVKAKAAMARHLLGCISAHDRGGGPPQSLFLLRAEGQGAPDYWMDLEARVSGRLEDLDRVLRSTWLECCGHASAFRIGPTMYSSIPMEMLGHGGERSLRTGLASALGGVSGWFRHDYDFGSTTTLRLRVQGLRRGAAGRRPVRLLARNEPLEWLCRACGDPAVSLCSWCDDGDALFCAPHAAAHRCGGEALLPVVNSPRMGVCAYRGSIGARRAR